MPWFGTGLALLMLPVGALGADLGSAGDFQVRWDTTLRATIGLRTEAADPALLGNINGNDGDGAFGPGLISDRLDWLSELEISRDDLGFYISGDGWYDGAYHGSTANRSPATFNPVSVPYNQFPKATQALDGDMAELLDAYGFARFTPGGLPLTLRLGRQTVLWGESLFFAGNSIAGAQSPVDEIKALGQPLAQNREIVLPVTQASARLGLGSDFSLEAYWQFEWRRDRLPGVASYFSTADYLDAGGERIFLAALPQAASPGSGFPAGGGYYGPAQIVGSDTDYAPGPIAAMLRAPDRTPGGAGQFGAALRYTAGDFDAGLYALRFAAKLPELFYTAGYTAGTYGLDFPRDIDLYGASLSHSWNGVNLAGEISARLGMPLLSGASPLLPAGADAIYATGTTLHADLSADAVLPPSRLWNSAELLGELAANGIATIASNAAALAPGRSRAAAAFRVAFTPSYYELAPNLDVSLPIGIGLGLIGRSAIDSGMNAGGGDVEIGISASYRRRWQTSLQFTHFIGGPGRQLLADRDFVSLSLSRSF